MPPLDPDGVPVSVAVPLALLVNVRASPGSGPFLVMFVTNPVGLLTVVKLRSNGLARRHVVAAAALVKAGTGAP